MNKTFRPSIFLSLFIVWAIVSLACSFSSKSEPTPTEPPKISTATPAPPPTGTPANTPTTEPPVNTPTVEMPADTPTVEAKSTETYLGDAVQDFGYTLTGVSVADPAVPGVLYKPETGKKLVAVEIIVSNISGEVLKINPLNTNLLDNEGFVYQADLNGIEGQLGLIDLFPGEQARGWVSFILPENATAANVKYLKEYFGSDALQASLEAPPAGHQKISVPLTPVIPDAKLGDVVEQYGYSLSATAVEDPAVPGTIYTPREGHKLVAVELVLGNVSATEGVNVNPYYATLVDSNGFVYPADFTGRDGQLAVTKLNAGEKVKGWYSFTIPEDAVPAYLKYQTAELVGNYLSTGLAR